MAFLSPSLYGRSVRTDIGIESEFDPAATAVFPLAFDRVPLDQTHSRTSKA
jgi:hypothetical protein